MTKVTRIEYDLGNVYKCCLVEHNLVANMGNSGWDETLTNSQ